MIWRTRLARALPVALALWAALALPPVAFAVGERLDEAKAAGLVGERADGYLGVVASSAPQWAQSLVEEVNAGRRTRYAEIARERGTQVEAVAVLAGRKLIERAASGEYVLGTNGEWVKKP